MDVMGESIFLCGDKEKYKGHIVNGTPVFIALI